MWSAAQSQKCIYKLYNSIFSDLLEMFLADYVRQNIFNANDLVHLYSNIVTLRCVPKNSKILLSSIQR